MESIVTLMLSVRKLFGFLVPGFAWIVLFAVWNQKMITMAEASLQKSIPVPGILIAAGFVLAYLFGAVSTVIGFRLLEQLGDWLDRLLSHSHPNAKRRIDEFARRFHLLSTSTLAAEISRAEGAVAHLVQPAPLLQSGNEGWGIWKMYLIEYAPRLAKEAFDIEAEINFTGGMAPPIAAAATWLGFHGHFVWAALLLVVAIYLALRFQNLRHHEIVFLAQAYSVARQKNVIRE